MSPPLDPIVSSLEDAEPASRRRAAEALARMGSDAASAAVPLVKACGDPDSDVREWAAAALEDLGPPDTTAIPALGKLLASPNPAIGYWAVTLLGRAESASEAAVADLAACLTNSPFPEVRQRAAWALGKFGPGARSAIPTLEAATHSDDPRLARLAAQALESIRTP